MFERLHSIVKNAWIDPVWSKVISTIILSIGALILTTAYALLKSVYTKIPFADVAYQIELFLKSSTKVNNLLISSATIILTTVFLSFGKNIVISFKDSKVKKTDVSPTDEDLPIITENSAAFFSARLSKAFPGQRGFMWYEPKAAVSRLKILLQSPLQFKYSEAFGIMSDPIWWFRGHSAMFVHNFDQLSKTKILLNHQEIEIKRMAVYTSDLYYKSFVYIEAKGEKQTGLYNITPTDIEQQTSRIGYSSEEYALLNKRMIRREDYDDGATVYKGNVVDASNAKLRTRFLTDYNLIIAAKQSPYNSHEFSLNSDKYLNDILSQGQDPQVLFDFLDLLENNKAYHSYF